MRSRLHTLELEGLAGLLKVAPRLKEVAEALATRMSEQELERHLRAGLTVVNLLAVLTIASEATDYPRESWMWLLDSIKNLMRDAGLEREAIIAITRALQSDGSDLAKGML